MASYLTDQHIMAIHCFDIMTIKMSRLFVLLYSHYTISILPYLHVGCLALLGYVHVVFSLCRFISNIFDIAISL